MAYGDEAELPVDGLDQRQVVHADDAEDGVDAEFAQDGDEEIASGVITHGCSPQRMPRPTPPQTSMLVPVM